jgi:hypothetical protein
MAGLFWKGLYQKILNKADSTIAEIFYCFDCLIL